jgi:hypothetical protein
MFRVPPLVVSALALALLLPAAMASAKEESKSKAKFENTGVEPDARGTLKLKMQKDSARLDVKLKGLMPDREYSLRADDVDQLFFDTNDRGKAKLELRAPEDGHTLLGFDPRNERISIYDGEDDVLVADLSDPSSVAKLRIKERTELEPTDLAGDGEAELRLKHQPNGKEELTVQTKHAPPGPYDVFVGGEERGSFDVNDGGSGKLIFKSNHKDNGKSSSGNPDAPGQSKKKKKVLLDFDPFAQEVELRRDGEVHFSGDSLADIPGFNVCEPDDLATTLDPTDGGSADAELVVADDCKLVFTVSVENVSAGDYDVFVDGVFIATIEAMGDPASGSVSAETRPDAMDDIPLSVDPRGERVEVFSGETLVFEGDFPE